MIHLGLETIELDGEPFKLLISEDDYVEVNQPIINIDLAALKTSNKYKTSMVIITNMDHIKELSPPETMDVAHGDLVQNVTLQ